MTMVFLSLIRDFETKYKASTGLFLGFGDSSRSDWVDRMRSNNQYCLNIIISQIFRSRETCVNLPRQNVKLSLFLLYSQCISQVGKRNRTNSCVCIQKGIYYKELAHVIMNAGECKIRRGQQPGEPGEPMFQIESKGSLLYKQE